MKDFITAQERLTFREIRIEELHDECAGCGRTSGQIVAEDNCTFEELEWESKTSNCGLWYCHIDCYRDSH